jgi:acyl carrier protein
MNGEKLPLSIPKSAWNTTLSPALEHGGFGMNDEHNLQGQGTAAKLADDLTMGTPADGRPHYVAQQTTLQEVLIGVWIEVLGVEKIGIQDDFFELGGDSILATRILSRLRTMFRMDLPATALFDAPTIEKLAEFMVAHEGRAGLTEKTAALLKKIQGMSEEEVARSLQ